jgi:deazaflavin-dependent oxidoreductase (nitroreductase family)
MAGAILIVLAVLFLALLAIAIVYVFGVRSESSTVRDVARRFYHGVGNPLQMRSAGTPGTFASVIRHQGRRTGRIYQTPVWAVPTEGGFVIAIVYGSGSDWLKNVLASGAAAIVHDGDTYSVDQPEIVPMESARAYFPATLQRTHRLVGVEGCLRVRRVKAATTSAGHSPRANATPCLALSRERDKRGACPSIRIGGQPCATEAPGAAAPVGALQQPRDAVAAVCPTDTYQRGG